MEVDAMDDEGGEDLYEAGHDLDDEQGTDPEQSGRLEEPPSNPAETPPPTLEPAETPTPAPTHPVQAEAEVPAFAGEERMPVVEPASSTDPLFRYRSKASSLTLKPESTASLPSSASPTEFEAPDMSPSQKQELADILQQIKMLELELSSCI